jgi:hypothetical protein
MVTAGICIVVAAFFLLQRNFNTAFVVAALGLVSWFLNYRIQMREITAAAELEQSGEGDEEISGDSWKDGGNPDDD